jgi:hypothetical protein
VKRLRSKSPPCSPSSNAGGFCFRVRSCCWCAACWRFNGCQGHIRGPASSWWRKDFSNTCMFRKATGSMGPDLRGAAKSKDRCSEVSRNIRARSFTSRTPKPPYGFSFPSGSRSLRCSAGWSSANCAGGRRRRNVPQAIRQTSPLPIIDALGVILDVEDYEVTLQ